ncbi:TerC/Alx family metal homeostasis membrane protein [Flavobacteriaceae bacterium Ap0902]|nr:TerC/Alx family metal homeostasis membrane protein [Flavobacteriaceae bacterium Ap0902]
MTSNLYVWIGLIIFIVLLLIFDLFVLHKREEVSNKQTAKETIFWILVAIAQSLVIYLLYTNDLVRNPTGLTPHNAVLKYITGYFIELSLSVDNLFVIAMIFKSFHIPLKYQHKALFWGILGAIVFRGAMIGVGVVLFEKISWIPYVFGGFLIYTAFKMLYDELMEKPEEFDDSKSKKIMRKYLKISPNLDGNKFFTIENGAKMATPLFGALILIEFTDILFAVDSIPAILAVTQDALLVFYATIFATLGLRSMYFFLANMLEKFHYLHYSIFVILLYIGIKLILMHHYEIPEWLSLGIIFLSLTGGVIVSLIKIDKTTV